MIVATGRRSERAGISSPSPPFLTGERVGGRSGPQILRKLMSTASPLTRSQTGQRKSAAGSSRPLPAKRGDHPAPESRLGAGIVTIGGLALRPSTWKPATRL
jgi:hypothetical protein